MAIEHFLPSFRPDPCQLVFAGTVAHVPESGAKLLPGGAAAGLVQYKTTSNQSIELTFSHSENTLKRLKRMKRNTYLSGAFLSLPRAGYRPDAAWLVTLTYDTRGTLGKGAHDWCPDNIRRATDAYRRWCKAAGLQCKYCWVAELQSNGHVHYHGVFWLPRGVSMPKWDRPIGKRDAFWRYGMTETAKLKTNVGYLMKYLSKMGELPRFPHGLRLSGCGGMALDARQVRSWYSLPSWVKVSYGVGEVKRCLGGFVDLSTGEVLPPMYRRQFVPGGLVLHPLREPPERWQPGEFFGPYSTWRP